MATKAALPNGNGSMSRAHSAELKEQKMAIAPPRRKQAKKVEDEGLVASLCTLVCEHQIGISSLQYHHIDSAANRDS